MIRKLKFDIIDFPHKLKRFVSFNFLYIFFGVIILCGFIFGCKFSNTDFDITPLKSGSFTDIFISYLSSLFIYEIILFIFGFSAVGVILIPVTVFFRGLGLGAATVSLYQGFGSDISLWSILLLLPHFLLFALYMIYLSRLYFKLSFASLSLMRSGNNHLEIKSLVNSTFKKTTLLMFVMLAGALIYCFSILFMQTII